MTSDRHVPQSSHRFTRGAFLALAVPGAVLLGLIVTRTFATYVATFDPATALFLQPNESRALLLQAEIKLTELLGRAPAQIETEVEPPDVIDGEGAIDDRLGNIARLAKQALARGFEVNAGQSQQPSRAPAKPALSDQQVEPIRTLAVRSLQSRPINSDALSLIARLDDLRGQPDQTAKIMETTLRLSVRESYAAYWLLEKKIADGDVGSALKYADILMRTRSTSFPFVVPKLATLAETAEHRSQLAATLAKDPPWRATFFARFMGSVKDARTPLFQLLELKKTAAPPTRAELALYLNFLAVKNFHELAYYAWLQFQPPEALAQVRPVKNGGFESSPDGGPFDWSIVKKPGVHAALVPHPSKSAQKVLSIEFRANRAYEPSVRQTLILPPGTYRLNGQFAGSLLGPRGLTWRVRCLPGATLAATDVLRGSAPGWTPFGATFTVPVKDCRVQSLWLALDEKQGTERFISGKILFDDLAIQRSEAVAQDGLSQTPAR